MGDLIAAPGGFDMYAGAEPMSAWGHAGELDKVNLLLNLDLPQGWIDPKILKVKDFWNDAGAGPWAQDDANPDYVGFALGGAKIKIDKKYVIPLGSFPTYDVNGNVKITKEPILDNPFYPAGKDKLQVYDAKNVKIEHKINDTVIIPGDKIEPDYLAETGGELSTNKRVLKTGQSVTYKFLINESIGAGIDFDMIGLGGYKIQVSPDGKQWFEKLNTWSESVTNHSIDVSNIAGCADELVRQHVIEPGQDEKFIIENNGSVIADTNKRYTGDTGYFVYKLDLSGIVECHLDFVIGNGYNVQVSKDGKSWEDGINANQQYVRETEKDKYTDAGWVRILEITKFLNESGSVYVKISSLSDKTRFNNKNAFLRRMTVYSVFKTGTVFVKVSNTYPFSDEKPCQIEKIRFRKWSE
jgi:hypothetical protein